MTRTTRTLTTRPATTATTAILVAVLVALLAGCGSSGGGKAGPSPTGSGSSSSTSTSGGSSGAVTLSSDAVTAATAAFTTWDRPTLSYADWWAHLKPLLSAGGRLAFAGTDPANIPALTVTGPYRLDPKPPDDPDTTALVHVSTRQGPFGLLLSRSGSGADWFLIQINFPPGIH